ncbi:MAG: alpha/beta fold hydrolase [Salinivirgaceae bacterium]|nr:alpha/beta fold hydrolase [Salinivirgaceae bacterium]
MPHLKWTAIILTFLCIECNAQLYHSKTGKIIPTSKADTILWTSGIFNHFYSDFGTLVVKENRQKRDSRLITIPVIRIKAFSNDSVLEPIFLLNGGPGESNINPELINVALLENHDFVLVGYRGVDGSTSLDCPELSKRIFADSLWNNKEHSINEVLSDCFVALSKSGIDISGYTMHEVVYDIESVRKNLGYEKISFISFSYGTMLSQLYDQTHPNKVAKLVLIGARPIGDFHFYGEYLNDQIELIYKYYFKDSTKTGFRNFTEFMLGVHSILSFTNQNNSVIDCNKLLFFAFAQLYSVHNIEKTFHLLKSISDTNTNNIALEINKFYLNYPGELILPDLYLKKYEWGWDNNAIIKNGLGIGSKISDVINMYYNPSNYMDDKPTNFSYALSTTKTLIFSGELDVAAPPELISKSILPYYSNCEDVFYKKNGHLNLIIDKKEEVNYSIVKFFEN